MKKFILAAILLVFVSACITGQAPKITCESKFLKQAEVLDEDLCEPQCYDKYKSLNYDYVDNICYCDIVGCQKETTTTTTIEIVTTEETTTSIEIVTTEEITSTAETTIETTIEETTSTTVCEQVITIALSPEGECSTFQTPCDVPENWTVVDECPTTSTSTTVMENETMQLEVSVSAEPNPLTRGNEVTITVSVSANESTIEGAAIEAKIIYATGYTVTNTGITNSDGKFTWIKTIGGNATPGTFTAEATATKEGYDSNSGSTTFEVVSA